jgi:hypothetical protein
VRLEQLGAFPRVRQVRGEAQHDVDVHRDGGVVKRRRGRFPALERAREVSQREIRVLAERSSQI